MSRLANLQKMDLVKTELAMTKELTSGKFDLKSPKIDVNIFFFQKLKPGQQWGGVNLQVGDVLLNNMTLIMIHMEQEGKPLDKKCRIDIFGHYPNKFGSHPPLSQTVPLGTYGPYLPFPEVKQIFELGKS